MSVCRECVCLREGAEEPSVGGPRRVQLTVCQAPSLICKMGP